MIKTPAGDFYTPKEILALILKAKNYPEGEYELHQTVFGGLIVRQKSKLEKTRV
jgi:hypothetical protein